MHWKLLVATPGKSWTGNNVERLSGSQGQGQDNSSQWVDTYHCNDKPTRLGNAGLNENHQKQKEEFYEL